MPRKAGDAETSMFTRGRIIGMYEGGVPKMMISKKLNIDPKTIRKWILRYEAHGESGLKSIPKPGAHRKTTAYEDVAIAQAVAVTPSISAQEINKMLGLNISAHTIRRRVRDAKIRSRQEKKEGRLAKKKKVSQGCTNNPTNSLSGECSLSVKKKAGANMKKTRKKKQNVQISQQINPIHQQQPQLTQMQNVNIAKQNMSAVPVPVLENGIHPQFIGKVESIQPTATITDESHNAQLAQTHQYQSKQMPFYGFAPNSGYEFPRIWTPVTNVRNAYCETPKLEFSTTEVTQITHSSVQTTGFLNPSVSSPN
ncbi:hypothetical protein RUM44_012504 [Polyplax serrata]|uniref:Transposase n=1 Tax=Polyplax serrata TaxID=468196 RepID=A0ABR1BBU8_POLSC